jgi:hypothetical protein
MRWRWGDGIELVMDVVEWSFLSLLLLAKDVNNVLQLREPHVLSVDVLPVSLGALDYGLSSHDRLLLLLKPLNFLLDSGRLFHFCFCFFFDFLVLVKDMIEIYLSLDYLRR